MLKMIHQTTRRQFHHHDVDYMVNVPKRQTQTQTHLVKSSLKMALKTKA